eukprot:7196-Hanusia_phi.AAC.1
MNSSRLYPNTSTPPYLNPQLSILLPYRIVPPTPMGIITPTLSISGNHPRFELTPARNDASCTRLGGWAKSELMQGEKEERNGMQGGKEERNGMQGEKEERNGEKNNQEKLVSVTDVRAKCYRVEGVRKVKRKGWQHSDYHGA